MTDPEIRNRFMILTWVVGVTAALVIAVLGSVVSLSYQVGQINGQLSVLISHVTLK